MIMAPSKLEVLSRIEKLLENINSIDDSWDAVFLVDKLNQYYFTGTMQEGVFVLKRNGDYAYFARKSIERAELECIIDNLYPMKSYKDVFNIIGDNIHKIYIESEVMTYGMLERLKKYFDIKEVASVDSIVLNQRAVKSQYELSCMRESGRQHKYLFETIVPNLLREGMNETELSAQMYEHMIRLGFQGTARFSMFQTNLVIGQIGFGENSLYPTSFDGPGGMKGMHPAAPIIGDRKRLLKHGDLVFVDIGYGVYGYHTDRTQVYLFGQQPTDELSKIQNECRRIQKTAAQLLKPGNKPSDIYNTIIGQLDTKFIDNFMGFSTRTVKFLGHGVGLQIDEFPVISNGFNNPLLENMTIAIEPKKGVAGVGLLGVEDTYIVTHNGGECITGGEKEIFVV